MGYYVDIQSSDAVLSGEHLDDAYKAMCDLNKRDDLKGGGSSQGGKMVAKWFSWMDEKYPETCKSVEEILEMLGFYVAVDPNNGDVAIDGYDNKTGQEELFLEAIAPWMKGEIVWQGEDGTCWKNVFENGRMKSVAGHMSFEEG
jgi:hypothetical protein